MDELTPERVRAILAELYTPEHQAWADAQRHAALAYANEQFQQQQRWEEWALALGLGQPEHLWDAVWCGDRDLCGDQHIVYYRCRACGRREPAQYSHRFDPGYSGIYFGSCLKRAEEEA